MAFWGIRFFCFEQYELSHLSEGDAETFLMGSLRKTPAWSNGRRERSLWNKAWSKDLLDRIKARGGIERRGIYYCMDLSVGENQPVPYCILVSTL